MSEFSEYTCMYMFHYVSIYLQRINPRYCRWYARNYIRIMCQRGDHSKKVISPFFWPWCALASDASKVMRLRVWLQFKVAQHILRKEHPRLVRSCIKQVISRCLHWFLTCTRLRRNHRVLACSEEHNPGDDSGSNTISLGWKNDEALFRRELRQRIPVNWRKETENERNEKMRIDELISSLGDLRIRISFQDSKLWLWLCVGWVCWLCIGRISCMWLHEDLVKIR